MKKLSKSQQFVLDFALALELNTTAESPDISRYYTTANLGRKPTLAVLEREGLLESFPSWEKKVTYRRGSGVIPTASSRQVRATRWRLTDKGREQAVRNEKWIRKSFTF